MPTYYANNVTASLAICDLQDTLSSDIFRFTGGSQARADATRVQNVFSFADKLYEKPLGASGIVQFIGIHEDMPLYMVEAKSRKEDRNGSERDADFDVEDTSQRTSANDVDHAAFYSDDSSLTSLGPTPTPTQQSFSDTPSKLVPPAPPTADALAVLAGSHTLHDKVEAAREWLQAARTKALVLDINLSDKSFLPTERAPPVRGSALWKDLKVEVFLNGQLAEATIVHGEMRRTTAHAPKGIVRVSGTRIHRQIEKAWIYTQERSLSIPSLDDEDAERRWNAVSLFHMLEADLRGRDHWGDLPPSAEFLKALAGLELPHEMKARQGLGIVDIVITAGKGRKYGPETSYLMKPTRLDDARYSSLQKSGASEVGTVLLFPQLSASKPEEATFEEEQSEHVEPESPLIKPTPDQRPLPATQNASKTTPRTMIDLTKEFDPNVDLDKTIVDAYMGSRGKLVKGRTLRKKLGNMKKMKPEGMEKELAWLKERYGSSEPAQKKQKMSTDLSGDIDVFFSGSAAQTKQAVDSANDSDRDSASLYSADPVAAAQVQLDAVQDESRKDLVATVHATTSISPQKTPKRRTKASALAGSPTHTPVKLKPPPRMAALSQIRPDNRTDTDEIPVSKQKKAAMANGSSDAQPKNNKSSSMRKSTEQSVTETLEAFQIPDCCKGSCVSFDEDVSAARLTGKARGGEFREESILVGMRFLVI